MSSHAYWIISETTEDRFDETDTLDEAIRIASMLVCESQLGEPISIEYRGKVIRQLIRMLDGKVKHECLSDECQADTK